MHALLCTLTDVKESLRILLAWPECCHQQASVLICIALTQIALHFAM